MTAGVAATSANTLATHGWWLASRASGLMALALVTVSVGIGLVMGGKLTRKPRVKKFLVALHEQTALASIIAIAVHAITLLGDAFLNPGVAGILIPFKMSYLPLFTGLGIIGGYLAALLGLSFYFRRRIGARLWRKAHRFTVVVYVLGVIHALGAGTDASTVWLQAWMLATAPVIAVLFLARLHHGLSPAKRPKPARPEAQPHGRLRRPAGPAGAAPRGFGGVHQPTPLIEEA